MVFAFVIVFILCALTWFLLRVFRRDTSLDGQVLRCFRKWKTEERLHDRKLMSIKGDERYFNYIDNDLQPKVKTWLKTFTPDQIIEAFKKVSRDNPYVTMNIKSILLNLKRPPSNQKKKGNI